MLARLIADWPAAGAARPRVEAAPPPEHAPELDLHKPDLNQGFVVGGFRTPTVTHVAYPRCAWPRRRSAKASAAGSSPNCATRKAWPTPWARRCTPTAWPASRSFTSAPSPRRSRRRAPGLLAEAEHLKENLLTDEELNRAREYVIGKFLMGHQSLGQRVGNLPGGKTPPAAPNWTPSGPTACAP